MTKKATDRRGAHAPRQKHASFAPDALPHPIAAAQQALEEAARDWREVEPFVKKRYLFGAEWRIAETVWDNFVQAYRRLDGLLKVPEYAALREHIRLPSLPQAPRAAHVPRISPFELVQTAALLKADGDANAVANAFPAARQLLCEAASYLREQETRPVVEMAGRGGISFAEILESNLKTSKGLKLLPGITSEDGLIKAIGRYFDDINAIAELRDESGEVFISKRFLPPNVLVRIRLWRRGKRRVAGRRGTSSR